MTKPSKKRTSTRKAKPAAKRVKKASPKPATEVVSPAEQFAKFDHDGDGRPGGSKPNSAGPVTEVTGPDEPAPGTVPAVDAETKPEGEGPATEVVAEAEVETSAAQAEPVEPEAEVAGEVVPEPEPEEPKAPEPSARPDRVMLGPVECRLKRLPTKTVIGLLSEESLRRVDAQHGSASLEATRQRMLASDGRATPVIMEDGDTPTLVHGFEELAVAVDCGAASLDVLLIPAGGVSEAQSHIVEMVRRQRTKGQSPDDDELFYRVHAEE